MPPHRKAALAGFSAPAGRQRVEGWHITDTAGRVVVHAPAQLMEVWHEGEYVFLTPTNKHRLAAFDP